MLKTSFKLLLITISVLLIVFLSACKSKSSHSDTDDESILPQRTISDTSHAISDTTTVSDNKVIKYNYTWSADKNYPPVAIVVDDFGYAGGKLLQGFAELDADVTFAILPDLPNTQFTARTANIHGHEVILHIPMEALDAKQSPGKIFIKAGDTPAHIAELINNFLEQVPQAVGANNHEGSRVTGDYNTIRAVMQTLNSKGLFFLDSRTNAKSKVLNAAKDLKMEYISRDIFLDVPDVSVANINAKLKELEKYKGRREPVIIISHCHNQAKLVAMQNFIAQLKAMGIRLIPISDAIKEFNPPA